jgi:hypothetical protein
MSLRRPDLRPALALAAMFAIGSAIGCGGGGNDGAAGGRAGNTRIAAPAAKADAAVVTYYYLPG